MLGMVEDNVNDTIVDAAKAEKRLKKDTVTTILHY